MTPIYTKTVQTPSFTEVLTHTSEIVGLVDKVYADKERLRRALIRYGVPVPLEGGKLSEWAAMIEGALMERNVLLRDTTKNMPKEVLVNEQNSRAN